MGGADPKPAPGSTASRPATAAPRPMPGSSATTSMSAGPPSGFGPDSATAQASVPVRSSPAPTNPVTSQPAGSGQGGQAGPRRAEGGQQRVDLAVPVTAPGAGPDGRLPDGLAAPRAGGWRMTVAFQAHGGVLPRSRAEHAGGAGPAGGTGATRGDQAYGRMPKLALHIWLSKTVPLENLDSVQVVS